jgi:hypothetical protein
MLSKNQISMEKIKVESLNLSNFYLWSSRAEPYLVEKGYEFHLRYDNFNSFALSDDYVKTDREKRFISKKETIMISGESAENKEAAVEELEDRFQDVGTKKANEEKAWRDKESKLKGLLKSLVDHIWINVEKLPSAALIWKQLKIEAQTKETGNFVALLIEFFAARQGEEEGLIFLMSRMNIMEKKILELGEAPTWDEIFCYRVLAALQPDKFDNLKSKIYQMPREEINIEKIKSMFQAEESWLMSKNATSSKEVPRAKIKIEEEDQIEAYNASLEKRNCSTLGCKSDMSKVPKRFVRCSRCQRKHVQEEEEKEKEKGKGRKSEEVQNIKVSKKKKKNKKKSSTSESFDSECSSY